MFSKPALTGTGSPAVCSAQRVASQPRLPYRCPSAPQISQVQAERATARSGDQAVDLVERATAKLMASLILSLVSSDTSPSQSKRAIPNFCLMRTN